MKWHASAPANIALIKYMGKSNADTNLPANASLSYTLEHLRSFVELEYASNNTEDCWEPLHADYAPQVPVLTVAAQQRFCTHLAFIKKYFAFEGHFIIRSANNFFADCGIASSAASFAALTRCAVAALVKLTHRDPVPQSTLIELSRQGSGSSCRSLMGPWVLWQGQQVTTVELPYAPLLHQVVVVSEQIKKVSSSQAHRAVVSSLLYQGRPARAERRLGELLIALRGGDWHAAYQLTWQEFWDMHALFETAATPFGYLESATLEVLHYLRTIWEQERDGPLITLDAGPNVHLLFRPEQMPIAAKIKATLSQKFMVL